MNDLQLSHLVLFFFLPFYRICFLLLQFLNCYLIIRVRQSIWNAPYILKKRNNCNQNKKIVQKLIRETNCDFDLKMSPASKRVGGRGRRSWMWLFLLTVAASQSHVAQASAQFAWTNIQTSVTRGELKQGCTTYGPWANILCFYSFFS